MVRCSVQLIAREREPEGTEKNNPNDWIKVRLSNTH